MVLGVLIHPSSEKPIEYVHFESPKEIFDEEFTIIGACVERNLVLVGTNSNETINNNVPWIEDFIHDGLYGTILMFMTDQNGFLIDFNAKNM